MSCRPTPDINTVQRSKLATTRCSSTVQWFVTVVLIQGQAVLASF